MVWTTKPPLGTPLDWSNSLNTGLVGMWIFNEGMGDLVNDLSGNGNIGSLINMAFPSTPTSGWNPGRLGPSIAFDGTDDTIQLGTNIYDLPDFSISVWINLISTGGYTTILGNQLFYSGWEFDMSGNNVSAYSQGNLVSNTVLNLGQWYNLVLTRSINGTTLYIDGNYDNSNANTTSIQTALQIGAFGNGQYLNALIDECRLWSRELSPAEALSLYMDPYQVFLECPYLICDLLLV